MVKKNGITDLTKLSVLAAEKLTANQFKLYQTVIFSLLNGVQFGFTELGPQFLNESNDIYSIHHLPGKQTKKVIVKIKNKKNKSNVINLSSYRKEDVKI